VTRKKKKEEENEPNKKMFLYPTTILTRNLKNTNDGACEEQ
jgi:hypothetical protein